MSLFSTMQISGSGLAAERVRVDAAASNLANAHSTRSSDGKPYRRMDPVLSAVDDKSGGGVQVVEVARDDSGGQTVYMPEHPDADAEGFVTLPNVDPVHEVVNLMSAQRGFEANATALETTKTLIDRALELLR